MQIFVTFHHEGQKKELFEGSDDDVRQQLVMAFPFLASKFGYQASLQVLLAGLNACQAFSVVIPRVMTKAELPSREALRAQLGSDPELDQCLAAAAFLAGKEPDESALQEAAVEHDGDPEAIALAACGLHTNEATRDALRGILGASMAKSEEAIEGPADVKDVQAATPDGEEFADLVRRAAKAGDIIAINLGTGKHSQGTALARDPETHRNILLKPGSGNLSPAAGVRETEASQSKRDAAFYAGAKAMELGRFVPECHLLLVDGREISGIKFLPPPWKNMNQIRRGDVSAPRRILSMYLYSGDIHRWATMDLVYGNTDSHSGNVMSAGGEVELIDHGSAFAGPSFNPAKDPKTYVPFYLRVFGPGNWKSLSPGQRYAALPRLHPAAAEKLGNWLQGLSESHISAAVSRYGIDPGPVVARLKDLKSQAAHMSPDLAINAAWVL